MNSFNHCAFGAIGDWLYREVAGIEVDAEHPGYKHIFIRPRPGRGLHHAEASLSSMYGKIVSSWAEKDGEMMVRILIPPNTSATATLPSARLEQMRESGMRIADADGVLSCAEDVDGVRFELGSGDYCFTYRESVR